MKTLACLAVSLAWPASGQLLERARTHATSLENPFDGEERARRAGAKLFARECAACHGENGEGSPKAPVLKRPAIEQAPPGVLFWVLKNGSLRKGMPSFAHIPEQQRWQIVTFLQTRSPDQQPGEIPSSLASRYAQGTEMTDQRRNRCPPFSKSPP